jgi:hypothetical protein
VLERRHEEHRVHLRRELPVHVGHLELGLEVGDRAQPADEPARADPGAQVHREPVERDDLDPVGVLGERLGDRGADRLHARVGGVDRRLPRIHQHGDDDAIEDGRGTAQHVHVPVRDRVERARIDRDAHQPSAYR